MNSRIGLLGAILGIQVLLVAFLLGRDAFVESEPGAQLLAFEPGEVTRVEIASEDASVILESADEAWRIDGVYPADKARIRELLDRLATLDARWPVATSAESAERFEVTESKFQRRLKLANDSGVQADLLLGTSPGYRRVHARVPDEPEVYSIDFANHEVPAEADHWLDKSVLSAIGEIRSVALDGSWRLVSEDAPGPGEGEPAAGTGDRRWVLDGAAADQDAAARLAERFETLQVLGIANDTATWVEKGRFAIEDATGTHAMTAWHAEPDDDYSFTSDRVDGRFTVATYIAEQMLVDKDTLLPEAAAGMQGDDDEPPEAREPPGSPDAAAAGNPN